jgi:hypothetical protein
VVVAHLGSGGLCVLPAAPSSVFLPTGAAAGWRYHRSALRRRRPREHPVGWHRQLPGQGPADTIMVAMVSPRPTMSRWSRSLETAGSTSRASGPPPTRRTRLRAAAHHSDGRGSARLPIDYYVEVNVAGLVKPSMRWRRGPERREADALTNDRSQNLHIDLRPGMQHLDGTQAMGYVRFRHDAPATSAAERQRQFMRGGEEAALARSTSPPCRRCTRSSETVNTNLTLRTSPR